MSAEYIQACMRVMGDGIPGDLKPSDTILYCFAHNIVNLPIMAKTVKKEGLEKKIPIYLLGNESPMSGVMTHEETVRFYEKELQHPLFPISKIPYSPELTSINTKLESNAVASFVKKTSCVKHIVVCTPVFHTLRAGLTLVSSLMDANILNVKIHFLCADVNDWTKPTVSHQGKTKCTFYDMLPLEIERIEKYTKKGDIRDINAVLKYFFI